jgi:predicted RNase H-like HicB family nuclease
MRQDRYTVLFEPAEEDGYVVACPALSGIVTRGETLEEARAVAADAISGYLESLFKDGLPIPDDTAPEPIKERITVVLQAASSGGRKRGGQWPSEQF